MILWYVWFRTSKDIDQKLTLRGNVILSVVELKLKDEGPKQTSELTKPRTLGLDD